MDGLQGKLPLKPSNTRGPPHLLPRYLQLELSRHMHALRIAIFARFCLHALTLRIEAGCWQIYNWHCDKVTCIDVQDQRMSIFMTLLGNVLFEKEIQS